MVIPVATLPTDCVPPCLHPPFTTSCIYSVKVQLAMFTACVLLLDYFTYIAKLYVQFAHQ